MESRNLGPLPAYSPAYPQNTGPAYTGRPAPGRYSLAYLKILHHFNISTYHQLYTFLSIYLLFYQFTYFYFKEYHSRAKRLPLMQTIVQPA